MINRSILVQAEFTKSLLKTNSVQNNVRKTSKKKQSCLKSSDQKSST